MGLISYLTVSFKSILEGYLLPLYYMNIAMIRPIKTLTIQVKNEKAKKSAKTLNS